MKFQTLFLLLLSTIGLMAHQKTNLIPRSVFFGNTAKRFGLQLSPTGDRLAYVAEYKGVYNIWLRSVDNDDSRVLTTDNHRGITSYSWLHDETHLVYIQDKDGDENDHLYLFNIDTQSAIDITPYEGIKVLGIDIDKKYPDYIWFEMNKEDKRYFGQYRYQISTGETTCTFKNEEEFAGHVADESHITRLGIILNEDGGQSVWYRHDEDTLWGELFKWNLEDSENSGIVGFGEGDKFLYYRDSTDRNTSALMKIDLETAEITEVAADEEYEVSPILEPETKKLVGIVHQKDRSKPEYFDEERKKEYERLSQLDDGDFAFVSWNKDRTIGIFSFFNDNDLGTYYLYNRTDKSYKKLFKMSHTYDEYKLARMKPISYEARDGLTIHGYLSTPVDTEPKNLPLVLLVHGGPFGVRDSWGFSSVVQWLCNRGYAVLQVNYRGSDGYGKQLARAGYKEWGRNMQHDLTDAVAWAVEQGIANPKRVAIMGGSYGGYAALAGATFTPDLYKCAIDIVGPSNLFTLINSFPTYWEPLYQRIRKRIGDPEVDADMLHERSPLFSAHKIKCPVLIGQGANDPRVKQAESEQIVAALKENNVEHVYLLFPDEGHGFARPENNLKFYTAAEKFLADNLGGYYEA